MSRTWSPFQTAIFDFVRNGSGNAVVEAVAGSGKTTTIVEALGSVLGFTIFLAFNKAIAEELKKRGVNARTFHSLTYGPVLKARGAASVTPDKLRELVREHFTNEQRELYAAFATRLVGLARQSGMGCLIQDTEDAWNLIAEHHDLELEHEDASWSEGIAQARRLLTLSNESKLVDFDDLLYFAVRDGVTLPKFDFVFVDEAQDTNAIQRAILRKLFHGTTRMIAVGDPAQAIYGFRGADSNSLGLIAREFDCITLPLTVSYRCATSIVDHARTWVSHITAAPGAQAGSVRGLGASWNLDVFAAEDLVVCRTTKPLIALGYSLLRERRPFFIMGKDIGQGLKSLVNRMKAKGIDALLERLEAYRIREVEKATAKGQDGKVEAINDKISALVMLCEGLNETARTIPELLRIIDQMFAEKNNATILATIHKSKGLEARRVFWLNASACPAQWAKQPWQHQQERNLCYVATTRAIEALILIEEQ